MVISGDFPFWTASLDIISEPPRTKYSEEPELYRFLARTKTCREIRIGPGDWLLPNLKMSSGRTAMYSPEGIFPLGITHSSRPAAKLNKKVFRPERTVCVQSRKRFFTPEQPIYPGLSRNCGEATTRRSRNYVSGPGT